MNQTTLSPAQLAALEYALGEASADEAEIRNYSGRFMYGAKCLAIVSEYAVGTIAALIYNLMDDAGTTSAEVAKLLALKDVHTDSMAFSTVAYWPQIALPEDFKERNEDDDED